MENTRYPIADKPTRVYIILVSEVISPNKKLTKSKSKAPISPQFKAPINTSDKVNHLKKLT